MNRPHQLLPVMLSALLVAPSAGADLAATAEGVVQALGAKVRQLHASCSHPELGLTGSPRIEALHSTALVEVTLSMLAEDLPALFELLEANANVSLETTVLALTTEMKNVPCVAHGPERPYPPARTNLLFEVRPGRSGPSETSRAIRRLIPQLTTNYFLAFGKVARPRPPRRGDPPPTPPPPPEDLKPLLRDLRMDGDGNVMANIVVPEDQAAVDRLVAMVGEGPAAPVPGAWAQRVEPSQLMRRPIFMVDLRGALPVPGREEPEEEEPPRKEEDLTGEENEPPAKEPPVAEARKPTPEAIRAAIQATLGAKFSKTGSNPKKGLSPAGLVRYVYARLGLRDLPRTAREIHADPRGELLPRKGYRPELGDVVFFVVRRGEKRVRYPGVVLDPTKGVFVVSLAKKGVVRMSLRHPSWRKRFESAKRFLEP